MSISEHGHNFFLEIKLSYPINRDSGDRHAIILVTSRESSRFC